MSDVTDALATRVHHHHRHKVGIDGLSLTHSDEWKYYTTILGMPTRALEIFLSGHRSSA